MTNEELTTRHRQLATAAIDLDTALGAAERTGTIVEADALLTTLETVTANPDVLAVAVWELVSEYRDVVAELIEARASLAADPRLEARRILKKAEQAADSSASLDRVRALVELANAWGLS